MHQASWFSDWAQVVLRQQMLSDATDSLGLLFINAVCFFDMLHLKLTSVRRRLHCDVPARDNYDRELNVYVVWSIHFLTDIRCYAHWCWLFSAGTPFCCVTSTLSVPISRAPLAKTPRGHRTIWCPLWLRLRLGAVLNWMFTVMITTHQTERAYETTFTSLT